MDCEREDEKEFFWNDFIKIYVNPCIMPHAGDMFTTIGIELINFRRRDVEIQSVVYGDTYLSPTILDGKDTTMPHTIPGRDRWFVYLKFTAIGDFDPKNIEVVCVTTTRGFKFTSECQDANR